MNQIRMLLLAVVACALVYGAGSTVEASHPGAVAPVAASGAAWEGGVSNIDELVKRFLSAVERKDRDELERLRIGERDYLGIILPGTVEPGQPLQRVDRERAGPFWWEYLSERSALHRDGILDAFGGHHFEIVERQFTKGVKQYANHAAHRRLRLVLRDENGEQRELQTGSIAEVDGRFKFISYVRD